MLIHSCTALLEMAAILCDIQPGDEVIMPSFTFVSTANAFALRGATIRFVDIRPDTLNLDEHLIEPLITEKTRAIVPVHYAGVGCDMDAIMDLADQYRLLVVEDAAQGVNSTYKGRYLGTIGHLGTYSFHETKNVISREGGALVINDERFILCEAGPGHEVIMPSFAFVSVANAFHMQGATPVFVDIRPDTLNLDPDQVAQAVTDRTRVIVTPHYAGIGCDMEKILEIARDHDLLVVEDAANGFGARYGGRCLGTMGDLGILSFHETNNIICGEGGALLINKAHFFERAEIIREKGTNRSKFFRGEVDKYSWVDIGSSFLPSDLVAAFLFAQLEMADTIIAARSCLVAQYMEGLQKPADEGLIRLPQSPGDISGDSHIMFKSIKKQIAVPWIVCDAIGFRQIIHHGNPAQEQDRGVVPFVILFLEIIQYLIDHFHSLGEGMNAKQLRG